MTIQMQGRKDRLSWLIAFINENAVLDKVGTHIILPSQLDTHTLLLDDPGMSPTASHRFREALCMP